MKREARVMRDEATVARWREVYGRLPQSFLESWQVALEDESRLMRREAMRLLFLIHAGALVALAALLGNIHDSTPSATVWIFIMAAPFYLGLSCVVLSALMQSRSAALSTTGYLNLWLGKEDVSKALKAISIRKFARLCLVVSLAFIFVGFGVAVLVMPYLANTPVPGSGGEASSTVRNGTIAPSPVQTSRAHLLSQFPKS